MKITIEIDNNLLNQFTSAPSNIPLFVQSTNAVEVVDAGISRESVLDGTPTESNEEFASAGPAPLL